MITMTTLNAPISATAVRYNGGRWSFEEITEGHWRWLVNFKEGRIICPNTFSSCMEALQNARDHGYGVEISKPVRVHAEH